MMQESGTGAPVRMVSLRVEGELLAAPTELLCRHSPYFSAMFSGHFRERDQDVIDIQIIKAKPMKLILTFMETGEVDLSDLSPFPDLISAARYLQLDELIHTIETKLSDNINLNSWADILEAAKAAALDTVSKKAATFGLLSFDLMKSQFDTIKTLSMLQWYLSHSCLLTHCELDVFEFGISWLKEHQINHPNAILLILGCLSINRLQPHAFSTMVESEVVKKNRIALGVVKCLQRVKRDHGAIGMSKLELHRRSLIEEFTEEVLVEVWPLVSDMVTRKDKKTGCIVGYDKALGEKSEESPQFLYKCVSNQVRRCRMVAGKGHWGWSCVAWGPRLVVVGGEIRRGTGIFYRSLSVLDVLDKAWRTHDVKLPSRRHAGVIVHDNIIFMVGGVGKFRVLLKSCVSYNLRERTPVTALPDLPEAIQSPALAMHRGELLVAGQRAVYALRGDHWQTVVTLPTRANCLLYARDRLFYTQAMQRELFTLDLATGKSEMFCTFKANVVAILSEDIYLQAFTESSERGAQVEFRPGPGVRYYGSFEVSAPQLRFLPGAGCFALAFPPACIESDTSGYALALLRLLEAPKETVNSSDKTT